MKSHPHADGIYVDRIFGGHCDHCHFGGIIVAGLAANVPLSAVGVIKLTAASAKLVGDSIQVEHADTEANVGFWSNPADRVEWQANVTNAGIYHVELMQG